ncbi:MAG TPA: hypothetical protein VJJ23_03090 [Candidatus Nanoarchaeia archaeon]|nr:hypothetical protein [Candidatus Nanoarchaeia archaeon]
MKYFIILLIFSLLIVVGGCVEEGNFISTSTYTQKDSGIIEVVHITRAGYVVVHENNDGVPGEVLGVSELIYGTNYDIKISNNKEPTTPSVVIKLYYDNGDSVFDIKDDIPVESNGATIIVPIGSVIPRVFNGSLQRFEPFKVDATILDIYTVYKGGLKEMGKIKINKILEPCGSSAWKCKTKMIEGDVLEVFFEGGTKVEGYCPPDTSLAPCSMGYDIKKGDDMEAMIQIDIEDSSYKRNLVFVIREIEKTAGDDQCEVRITGCDLYCVDKKSTSPANTPRDACHYTSESWCSSTCGMKNNVCDFDQKCVSCAKSCEAEIGGLNYLSNSVDIARMQGCVKNCQAPLTTCGNGICENNEGAIGCDPPNEGQNPCVGYIFCPEDCAEGDFP